MSFALNAAIAIGLYRWRPGFMKTELGGSAPLGFRIMLWLTRPLQTTPERGADTALWLASSPEAGKITNQFSVKRRPMPCTFRDPTATLTIAADSPISPRNWLLLPRVQATTI